LLVSGLVRSDKLPACRVRLADKLAACRYEPDSISRSGYQEARPRMVYLSRIYTKTGDLGETSLGDGARVPKDHPRVAAYGDVDELNAVLGLLLAHDPRLPEADLLRSIQNDLFDVGADLCVPQAGPDSKRPPLRIQAEQGERLEHAIDRLNERLAPLTSFALPGGRPAAAWCHVARTVCRRAERAVVTLARAEAINPQVIIYLNRLSDLLFVLARIYNGDGREDVLWQPGATQRK
jgi:cob(I)alamin adenosyltransferase